jgi:hypothetical protein
LIRRVSIAACLPQPPKEHTKTLKGSSFTNYSVTDLFSTNYSKWAAVANFDQHETQYIKKTQTYELLSINYIKKDAAIFSTLEWNLPVHELYHSSQPELGYYGKYISQNKSSGYLHYVIPSKSYDIQLEEHMNTSENDIRLKKLDKKGSILSNTYRNTHYKLTTPLEDIKNKSEMEQILQTQTHSKVKKNIENLTSPLNPSAATTLSWPKAKSVVWLLFGGDDDGSVIPNLNNCLDLTPIPGLKEETFLLISPTTTHRHPRFKICCRRNLKLRNLQLFLGLPHYMVDHVFQTRNPLKLPYRMLPIIAVPPSLLHYKTIFEIQDECQSWEELYSKSEGFLTDTERDIFNIYKFSNYELLSAGIKTSENFQQTNEILKEDSEALPRPKRLDLETFALEARLLGATVFISVSGDIARNGQLQAFFDENNVVYTGSGSQETAMVSDKLEMFLQLGNLNRQGIFCAFNQIITYREVLHILEKDYNCEDCYEFLRSFFSPMSESFGVKPIHIGSNDILTRLDKASDLSLYLRALRDGSSCIPTNTLSQPHKMISLPRFNCDLQFEQLFNTKHVLIKKHQNERRLEWTNESNWVKVIMGLIGCKYNMQVLLPSFTAKDDKNMFSHQKTSLFKIDWELKFLIFLF